MSFDNPRILWFILLLLISVPVLIIRYRKDRGRAALFALAAPSDEREFFLRELQARMIVSDIFFLLFLIFLVIALAGPRWGVRVVADHRRGIDIVMAFDLSRSMDVRDCPPFPESGDSPGEDSSGAASRLERGAGIARDFAAGLGDVRLGIAIGKGRGIVAIPLTYDSDVIEAFLQSMNSRAVTGTGTDLESLLDAASGAFQDDFPSQRLIVLFSDGETLSGSLQAAAEKVRRRGVIMTAVGLGSDGGGTVPVEESPDTPGGFLLAADGVPVISRLEADALRNGTEKTGGVYIDGSLDDTAAGLNEFVNSLSAEIRLSGHRREANPRWQIFVLAAMACLAGSRLMGFHHRKRRRTARSVMLGSVFCLIFFGSCAKSQGMLHVMEGNFFNARGFYTEAISSYLRALGYENMAPYAEYGLGAAYFALEEGDAALERYRTAEKTLLVTGQEEHPELRYRLQYNSGIIYFENGEYGEAVRAFREALKIDGSRIEAKRNLELSLLTVARASAPQTASPGSGTEEGHEGSGGGSSVLFEYLEEKEREQWKSREWSDEGDSSGPDY